MGQSGKKLAGAVVVAALATVFALAAEPVAKKVAPPSVKHASAELARELNGLFERGFAIGPKSLAAAEKNLAASRRLIGDDVRLNYAWGLVLVKQSQLKPAAAQFETATKQPGEFCWPAWQALIWVELVDKQYDKALKRLTEFAAIVRKAEPPGEPSEQQRSAARWIGEVLEALGKIITAPKTLELAVQHELRALEALGEELAGAVAEGRENIRGLEFNLEQQNQAAAQSAARKKEQLRDDQAGRLGKNLDDLEKQRKNTARSADEWKKWFDDTLGKIDKQLGGLERDYQFLEKRAQSLDRSITLIGKELTALQFNPPTLRDPFASQRVNQLQQQLFNYQTEYNQIGWRLLQISQQGQKVMQQRAAVVDQYEKATGELVKKNADLDKWSERVTDKKKKVESQPVVKAPKAKPGDRKAPTSFRGYVNLDIDRERDRVLEAFGIGQDAAPASDG
jgi:phage regulator Rha-like protein